VQYAAASVLHYPSSFLLTVVIISQPRRKEGLSPSLASCCSSQLLLLTHENIRQQQLNFCMNSLVLQSGRATLIMPAAGFFVCTGNRCDAFTGLSLSLSLYLSLGLMPTLEATFLSDTPHVCECLLYYHNSVFVLIPFSCLW
jgi:hypothetical protein